MFWLYLISSIWTFIISVILLIYEGRIKDRQWGYPDTIIVVFLTLSGSFGLLMLVGAMLIIGLNWIFCRIINR